MGQSGSGSNGNEGSLTIRLFSIISRTLIGVVLPLCRDTVGVFYGPSRLGWKDFVYKSLVTLSVKVLCVITGSTFSF